MNNFDSLMTLRVLLLLLYKIHIFKILNDCIFFVFAFNEKILKILDKCLLLAVNVRVFKSLNSQNQLR